MYNSNPNGEAGWLARELPGLYWQPLEKPDRQHRRTAPGETGALVARLQSYGELQCYVAGAWADSAKDLHSLLQSYAESRVEHLCRSNGRQEMEGQLSVIISQYRRRFSTCVVRANAQCLILRVGVISPAARGAEQRREVQGRLERQWREVKKAQWMGSLTRPWWGPHLGERAVAPHPNRPGNGLDGTGLGKEWQMPSPILNTRSWLRLNPKNINFWPGP